MGEAASALVPEVRTLARPASGGLLAGRTIVQHTPELRQLFEQSKSEGWTAQGLAERLFPLLSENLINSSEAHSVAQYLADEYLQLGDSLLVIDKHTGRAIAKFSEEDLYTPPAQRRESGELVTPPPRLRPELEGFLVAWHFNKAADEKRLTEIQAQRAQSTGLVLDEEPRLRILTQVGRASMIEDLRARLNECLHGLRGAPAAFLRSFHIIEGTHWKTPTTIPRCVATADISINIADTTTSNFRHDILQAHTARIGTAWVRDIARTLFKAAGPATTTISVSRLSAETLRGVGLWVVPPELYRYFEPFVECLPVEGVQPLGFADILTGWIQLHPESYRVEHREVFGRWEIRATMEYTLHTTIENLVRLDVTELAEEHPALLT